MAIAAVFAELRGDANVPSLFIIAYQEIRTPSYDFALPWVPCEVGRTKAVLSQMPPLLLELWREQHPDGHEQTTLASRPHALCICLLLSSMKRTEIHPINKPQHIYLMLMYGRGESMVSIARKAVTNPVCSMLQGADGTVLRGRYACRFQRHSVCLAAVGLRSGHTSSPYEGDGRKL